MSKRFFSIIVILAVVIFSESCIFPRTTKYSTESMSRGPGPKADIVRVLLKSGETREFGRKDHAHIINGVVLTRGQTVTVRTNGQVDISREGDTYVIRTGDGRTYKASFYSLDAAEGRLAYATPENAPIPLSEVAAFWTRDSHKDRVVLLLIGVAAVVVWAKNTPMY